MITTFSKWFTGIIIHGYGPIRARALYRGYCITLIMTSEIITWHTHPRQTYYRCRKPVLILKRGWHYEAQENQVPHGVVDKLRVGMHVNLPKFPPASVISVAARRLSHQSNGNVNHPRQNYNGKLENGPCELGYSALILPMWPLKVNDVVENTLTLGTSYKL